MRIPKIYLEITIFNYNFADDVPGKQQDNIKLFEDIENGLFEPYTSTIVVDELLKSREPQRSKMLELISKYDISVLPVIDEIDELAKEYVKSSIIPEKYTDDARHIACATIFNINTYS